MGDLPEPITRKEKYLYAIATGGGGGGGIENPNYVETIEGTLENPWGSISLKSLRSMLESNSATAYIDFRDGTYNVRVYLGYDNVFFGGFCVTFFGILTGSYFLSYTQSGGVQLLKKYSSTGSASDLSNTMTTTLTIIHHPMPSD